MEMIKRKEQNIKNSFFLNLAFFRAKIFHLTFTNLRLNSSSNKHFSLSFIIFQIYKSEKRKKEKKPKFIIDIATGRGQLVNKIAEEITHPYHLVCTDLSPFVLKQDRKNLVSDISSQKLSYIACDASNLPFENKSFEFATSLMGIMNMRDLIRKGISQVKRILEERGIFINTVLTIKRNSKSYNVYKEFLEEDDVKGIENYMLSPVIESLHKEIGFRKVEKKLIGESIAKENELDLIPVEGDWFSIENIYAYN
ncbi:MAG: hypothetical protein BAJALOKI2v1_750019 [Promethearchaeota archaeon]|nr:MAG: hypothetical protein BAJALOKI2v1_750019 [Candidatus Lokiarchaeota archaeon]